MQSLTLELSLKPFYGLDAAATRGQCRKALTQWQAAVSRAEQLSIILWVADGSEILDYSANIDDAMEWARYLGNANPHMPVPSDPDRRSLHARNYLYRDDAELLTYRRLAEIVQAWREVAAEQGRSLEIGATFDPGGEFAPSAFKYQRHREICLSNTMGKASFVCCYATLDADERAYAGYPNGIPQGTSLGTFLGRQFKRFAQDLGFDFLWLSNGFGFGLETWKTIGPLFDGNSFKPDRAPELGERIQNFWRDFREQCPDYPVRTRGTNLGTGTDLASDATPLRELYQGGFDFDPPPNSPWASINGDFGIELAGYQSRIAELPPGKPFAYRFYLHDPWWLNSPWIDRYEGQPHDIYLPLAVSRVTADGKTESAESMHLFTLDDSYGLMPDRVPNESIPHLLRGWDQRPDSAGPLVWLYPFDELHDHLLAVDAEASRLFHVDWFAREALNDGVPLNTVISTRAFDRVTSEGSDALQGRIIVTPTPLSPNGEQRLLDWIDAGGSIILYGPLDHSPQLRERLGLRAAKPLDGTFRVNASAAILDQFPTEIPLSYTHRTAMSGGALGEEPEDATHCFAAAEQNGRIRALGAAYQTRSAARVSWLRAPLPLSVSAEEHLPTPDSREDSFPLASLARQELAAHGWVFAFDGSSRSQRLPVLTLHRHANAWFFSGYMPDTTIGVSLQSPHGAPLVIGAEARVDGGRAHYHFPRAWRHECRVFIEQASGTVSTVEGCPAQVGVTRRLRLSGLRDATLRFFPPGDAGTVTLWDNPDWPYIGGDSVPMRSLQTPQGTILETTRPVSGSAIYSW